MEQNTEPVWTQIKINCTVTDLDTVCAIAGMVDNGLMIEDYSDVREGVNAIYGELLGEEILEKDPDKAAVSVFLPETRSVPEAMAFLRDRLRIAEIDATVETVGVKESDWADCWKKYYKPVHIGNRIVIVPAWEDYAPALWNPVWKSSAAAPITRSWMSLTAAKHGNPGIQSPSRCVTPTCCMRFPVIR